MSNKALTSELESRLGPLVASGDEAAIAELLAASEGLLRHFAHRFTKTTQDFEDLRQEGLIALWIACKTWEHEKGRWSSYAYPHLNGVLTEWFRHSGAARIPQGVNRARTQRAKGVAPTGSMVARLADADTFDFAASLDATDKDGFALGEKLASGVSVEGHAERRALLEAVETAIAGLDEKQRQVIAWRFTEELTFEEIGERLGGIGRSTVKKYTTRTLTGIREQLSDWAA
jgi:RNA polymerase sigma factor (sigma-70 family)